MRPHTLATLATMTGTVVPMALLIVFATAVTQAVKVLVIQPMLRADDPRQTTLTRVVAFVVSYGLVLANAVTVAPLSWPLAWGCLGAATVVFLGATGGYTLTGVALGTVGSAKGA